jgi:hypothetical protein
MNDQIGFVLKVVVASTAIAYLITLIGPILQIPPTNAIASVMVLLPTVVMAVILGWKARHPS